LNEKGEKVTNFKSLWKQAGMDSLQKHLNNRKENEKQNLPKKPKKIDRGASTPRIMKPILRNN
jgi:hypothetical protein